MILSDGAILEELEKGNIEISPFDRERLGSNSYDVRLACTLLAFQHGEVVNVREEPRMYEITILDEGYELQPGQLYLGVTEEWTRTRGSLVPEIDGKSSTGRLGIGSHVTAGRGDAGFYGHWTLEITVTQRTIVFARMPIAQLTYHRVEGKVLRPYGSTDRSKYQNQGPKPVPSMMWKNFR